MTAELEGIAALVTGGTRGIGKEVARRLAACGARVIVTGRSDESAAAAAQELSAEGLDVRGIGMDVADDGSVSDGIAGLLDDYGRIGVLVNNAGITCDNLLLRMKKEDWDGVLQTNLTGVYRMCRALIPSMVRARFGRVVNISSVVAGLGNVGQANYAAAKAGMEGFSRSMARELASRNITVNCVAPGFIDTDMTRELDDKSRRALLAGVPLGRLGTPGDVAEAVRFVVGPGSEYITGITLQVNGGMLM